MSSRNFSVSLPKGTKPVIKSDVVVKLPSHRIGYTGCNKAEAERVEHVYKRHGAKVDVTKAQVVGGRAFHYTVIAFGLPSTALDRIGHANEC